MTKETLRKKVSALRTIIPASDKKEADRAITTALGVAAEWQQANVICLYMSEPEEVGTQELFIGALNEKKEVVLPRSGKNGLTLHRARSLADLTRGAFGILEPKSSCEKIVPGDVDLFIVPGLAFDRQGNRLGSGKGFYDRLLSGLQGIKIGLAYRVQVVAQVPHSSYDVPMDMVVTEKGVYENKTS